MEVLFALSEESRQKVCREKASWGIKTREGSIIEVEPDLRLMTSYVLLEQESWFEDELSFVQKFVKKGMNCLDIGANHGVYTIIMGKEVGANGKVWAFEPATTPASYLLKSVKSNNLEGIVEICLCALSKEDGKATLHISPNSELNALGKAENSSVFSEEVRLMTLDSLLPNFDEKIDFVKLDAEGEEINILEGGGRFFRKHRPVVMFEIKHGNTYNLGLSEKLVSLGFQIFRLVPGLDALVPVDIENEDEKDGFWLNFFAVPNEEISKLYSQGLLLSSVQLQADSAEKQKTMSMESEFVLSRPLHTFSHFFKLQDFSESYFLFLGSKNNDLSLRDRYSMLNTSLGEVQKLSDFGSFMLRIKILKDLGFRSNALKILGRLINGFKVDELNAVSPFPLFFEDQNFRDPLPAHAHDFQRFLKSLMLESYERLSAFSGYFSREISFSRVDSIVRKIGSNSLEMDRRWLLLAMLGNVNNIQISKKHRIFFPWGDHLNSDVWKKILKN